MLARRLIRLGWQRLLQDLRETAYLKAGWDITQPYAIRGLLTRRCSHHCSFCHDWREKDFSQEMNTAEWCAALDSLRRFIGPYTIQFSGGEPSMHPGFLEIMEYCRDSGIQAGVVTNGSFLSPKNVARFTRARPCNLDISVDGPEPAIHDLSRRTGGSFEAIEKGIERLLEQMEVQGRHFPIRIKTTVHRGNFRSLPDLVCWSQRCGATTISFQPVRHWTPEVAKHLWLQDEDLEDLLPVMEELIALREGGAPIETPAQKIAAWRDYFLHEPTHPGVRPCRVGLGDYHIQPNGDVMMCWLWDPIGNVRQQGAEEIWKGEAGNSLRRLSVNCPKFGHEDCAHSCLARRPLREELQRGLMVLGGKSQGRKS